MPQIHRVFELRNVYNEEPPIDFSNNDDEEEEEEFKPLECSTRHMMAVETLLAELVNNNYDACRRIPYSFIRELARAIAEYHLTDMKDLSFSPILDFFVTIW